MDARGVRARERDIVRRCFTGGERARGVGGDFAHGFVEEDGERKPPKRNDGFRRLRPGDDGFREESVVVVRGVFFFFDVVVFVVGVGRGESEGDGGGVGDG